jgi:hypothetical protein
MPVSRSSQISDRRTRWSGLLFRLHGQLMIGGLNDGVGGAAPGDFVLHVDGFPDAIESSWFSYTTAPGEEFFTFNVSVATQPSAVPEPGTFALLGSGRPHRSRTEPTTQGVGTRGPVDRAAEVVDASQRLFQRLVRRSPR